MSFKLKVADLEVECDTAEELAQAYAVLMRDNKEVEPPAKKRKSHTNQSRGVGESWKKAEEFSNDHGIAKMQARTLITRAKKQGVEPEELLKKLLAEPGGLLHSSDSPGR